MDHIEMVEKLREKAGVSYCDAKDALEAADWDMLEAMIRLENEGKVAKESSEASSTETSSGERYDVVSATASVKNDHGKKTFRNMKDFILRIVRLVCGNSLMVRRKGKLIVKLPLILLGILCMAKIELILGLILIGLFLGCGYHVEGKDFGEDSKVNQVINDVNNSFDHMMNE